MSLDEGGAGSLVSGQAASHQTPVVTVHRRPRPSSFHETAEVGRSFIAGLKPETGLPVSLGQTRRAPMAPDSLGTAMASKGMLIGLLGVMIPILAIVLGMGVAFWAIYWDHRKKRLQYEERRLMIEKGMTPPLVVPDEGSSATPETRLQRGVIMLFVGIGLGIAYFVKHASTPQGPPDWLFGAGAAIVGLWGV